MSDSQEHPPSTIGFSRFFLYACILMSVSPEISKESGALIAFGVILLVALIFKLLDQALAVFEMPHKVRCGMWLAATLGPCLGILTFNKWQIPLLSAVLGLLGAIVGFSIAYYGQVLRRFLANCIRAINVDKHQVHFIVRLLGIVFVILGTSLLIYIVWTGGQYLLMANWVEFNAVEPFADMFVGMGVLFIFVGIQLWQLSELGHFLAISILLIVSVVTFVSAVTTEIVWKRILEILLGIFCVRGLIYLCHPTVKSLFEQGTME
ncbi:MAG: hypothetical protein JXA33_05150 [Anaerolineae bacterium]|nr:hypothetical protein [Anaerolineae bacterium]